jgi:hypothetical protein
MNTRIVDLCRASLAEVHATSMKRLSKIETADDPADVVKIEGGYEIE